MKHIHRSPYRLVIATICMLFMGLSPTVPVQAAVPPIIAELTATDDARTQAGSPDVNFGSGFLHFITLNGHRVFTRTAPAHTIFITEHGFEPAVLRAPAGSVIEWVNLSLGEHTTTNAQWDSGVLEPGQSYRFTVAKAGSVSYADAANPANTATIIVEERPTGRKIFLPLSSR